MDNKNFTTIVEARLEKLKANMAKKGDVYAFQDRLGNFSKAAGFLGCSSERALWGYVTKHIVALHDFITVINNQGNISPAELEEKIGDIMAYMILLEAILIENSHMPFPVEP